MKSFLKWLINLFRKNDNSRVTGSDIGVARPADIGGLKNRAGGNK